MNSDVLKKDAYLFPVRPTLRYATRFSRYGIGEKVFTGPNPPYGALITYHLKAKPDDKATFKVQIYDDGGKLVQEIDKPSKEKGMNRVSWNLRYGGAEVRRPPSEEESAFGGPPRGPHVLPGNYTVKLTVDDEISVQPIEVRLDPTPDRSAPDLQAQLELQMKLRDMQSAPTTL